ncbi:hypothetical protein Fmac_016199 [Flemingia macrophylla]|uniref:Co-chaperone protein p23-1 n=1 Tax=Flemingia macrophylla TaxID=520843 RepID=A0ABD1MGR4_9FABA
MNSKSTMSSVSFSHGCQYDVFLSFRGSDTRHGFISHLYKALCDKGICTFIDDEELQRGEEITPSLLKAIQESRIAIPVLSQNYASSTFCLDELVHILACFKEKGRLVLPVFYDVDPSHVRHQRGTYQEALNTHQQRFHDHHNKLQKWRNALRQVADLSGYHFKHESENECEFIGKIVKEVSQKVNRALLDVADYPIGLESRMLRVNSLLDIESGGVHMVGIYGVGGVGKTTIAKAIYNLIADQFDGLCFLSNVRENSTKHGLVHLQETLLSKTIGENGIKLGSVSEGIPIIKHRLHLKKVLLILDDVDSINQLRATVGETNWFGSGSRIIITTRDRHLLKCHGVEMAYEVNMMNKKEAVELLSWYAFRTEKVDPCYQNILNRVVAYTFGLPLALEIIGSSLCGKKIEEWESALDQYQRIPHKDILDRLKVSYDSLREDEQNIFLDIACFFKGSALSYVKEILSSHHGFCPDYAIGVLIDKSLVKIDENNRVTLHDLIEAMGKEIERKESQEPGKFSRLWHPEDIVEVLEENKGTSRIGIIVLDHLKNKVVDWDGMAFKEMTNLKTLIIRDGIFTNGPKHLPRSLRVLEWLRYSSPSLPFEFHPKKLVILRLPYSCNCSGSLDLLLSKKLFVNMRVLNFSYCDWITEIPDLCGVPNLQDLSFCHCENLMNIHESVGFLDKLKTLDANRCSKLRSFPPIKLTSLLALRLSFCDSLECFPKILGEMDNLTCLRIVGTPVKEIPFSIQNLTQLRILSLSSCGIVQLPSSIFVMQKLLHLDITQCEGLLIAKEDKNEEQTSSTTIDLKQCRSLINIPNISTFSIRDCSSLKELDLTLLPTWTKGRLRKLKIGRCKNLQNIKGIPLNIEDLMVEFCPSLKSLDLTLPLECTQKCRILRKLDLNDCEYLQEIKGTLALSNLRHFFARSCQSLTSDCRSKFLNKELDEAGGCKKICLPGTKIPEWFEHCANGSLIYFWFRNKLPSISVCAVIDEPGNYWDVSPEFTFNGETYWSRKFHFGKVADYLFIYDRKQKPLDMNKLNGEYKWNDESSRIEYYEKFKNKWHLVVCTIFPPEVFVKQIGIHIFEQGINMEDIQFINPILPIEDHILIHVRNGIVRYPEIWEMLWNRMKGGTILTECSKLMWRACQNRLSVRASKVTADPMCPMCGEAKETIVHALITCPEVRQVWFASPLSLRIDPSSVTDFSQWVYTLFERCDDEIVELVCTLLWSIWNRRNQWVNKFIRLTVSEIITEATNMMMIPKRIAALTETDCPLVIWKPPPPNGGVKANFKVLVKEGRGTGMGVVFRDYDGDILRAATHFRLDCMKVTIAEALCFRWVLQLAKEYCSVFFESDCQITYKMLNGEYASTEVPNNRYKLFCSKHQRVGFVKREANLLAEKLASLAFVYDQDMRWTKDIPHEAHPIAIMDAVAYNSCLSREPLVKWAQRSDVLYITVELADANDVKLKLKPEGKFYFSATAGAEKIHYELDIDLFDKINVNNSKARASSRNICCLVKKAKNKWWRSLLKYFSPLTTNFLRKGWGKWVDEHKSKSKIISFSETDFGDIDFSMLNMGGGERLDFYAAGNDDGEWSDTDEELSVCSDDWSDTEEEVTTEA